MDQYKVGDCVRLDEGKPSPPLTELCVLARKYGTDKGGWHMLAGDTCHNYTPTYDGLFKDKRWRVRNVLEIGVNYGPSLRMWEEYFPTADIYGLDSNTACLFNAGRIKCFAADQNNGPSLADALEKIGLHGDDGFDVIIDDGSHEDAHQIFSAQFLLPFLAVDGHYIIEDLTIDCRPELIASPIMNTGSYHWAAYPCGVGIGKAHCWNDCPYCHGAEGERLLVIGRKE